MASALSCSLELHWQTCILSSERMHNVEDIRRERTRNCLVESDKELLESQTIHDAHHILTLRNMLQMLSRSLKRKNNNLQKLRAELEVRNLDLDVMRAENTATQGLNTKHNRVLSEKLALQREICELRPELDALRLQQVSYNEVKAENYALQRQLGVVEVELQSERHGNRKTFKSDQTAQAQENEMNSKLKMLMEQLATEIRSREDLKKQMHETQLQIRGENSVLAKKLEIVKIKLKQAKDDLKTTKSELQNARIASISHKSDSSQHNSKVRSMAEDYSDPRGSIDASGTIQKNSKEEVGNQLRPISDFSVTPVLPKTGVLALGVLDALPRPSKVIDGHSGDGEPVLNLGNGGVQYAPQEHLESSDDDVDNSSKQTHATNKSTNDRDFLDETLPRRNAASSSRKKGMKPILSQTISLTFPEARKSDSAFLKPKRSIPDFNKIEPIKKRKILALSNKPTIDEDEETSPVHTEPFKIGGSVRHAGILRNFRLGSANAQGSNLASFGTFSPRKREKKQATR